MQMNILTYRNIINVKVTLPVCYLLIIIDLAISLNSFYYQSVVGPNELECRCVVICQGSSDTNGDQRPHCVS